MGKSFFHDFVEKCPRCGKYMTAEQAEHHICTSPLIDVKEIAIMYHYEACDKNGNTLIVARGYDGVLYRLRKRKKTHPTKIYTRRIRRRLAKTSLRNV